MKLEQQVVSLELAKKLKELGIKQESEFYWIEKDEKNNILWHKELGIFKNNADGWKGYSAFTVAELGEMIPGSIMIDKKLGFRLDFRDPNYVKWYVEYRKWDSKTDYFTENIICVDADTEADARAKMLIYLLENNLLTQKP